MALNFPNNPTVGDLYSFGGSNYRWSGSSWDNAPVAPQGAIGYTGSQGVIGFTGSASTVVGYAGSHGDIGYTGSASDATKIIKNDTQVAITDTGTGSIVDVIVDGTRAVVFSSTAMVPNTDQVYDLGSPTLQWKDVYVGPGSLYVNGQKVLQEDAGNIVVSCDINQNLIFQSSGSGNIELTPTGSGLVSIKGTLQVQTGNSITTSDGSPLNFGGSIVLDAISSKTVNNDLTLTANGTGNVRVDDNLVVTGDLTVSGTTTTINTQTLSIADNIIDLNSDVLTGIPTENAGIRVMRGDSTAVQIRWNEANDQWEYTNDGANYVALAAGAVGYTGSKGAIGYTGSASAVIGYTGSAGTNGYVGSQGIQGAVGFAGSAGATGYVGSAGSLGYAGSVGYTGSMPDFSNVTTPVTISGLTTLSGGISPSFLVKAESGAEGGQFRLEKPASGTTLAGNVVVDVAGDTFRVFENGGTSRGVSLNLASCAPNASTALWHSSNDGTGSGLDADLLDGQHGAYYAPINNAVMTGRTRHSSARADRTWQNSQAECYAQTGSTADLSTTFYHCQDQATGMQWGYDGTANTFGMYTSDGTFSSGWLLGENGAFDVNALTVNAAYVANTTSTVQLGTDIMFASNNHAIMGNLYFSGGWKYAGNGTGAAIKLAESTTVPLTVYVAPNNTSGAASVASPVVALAMLADGKTRVGTAGSTSKNMLLEVSGQILGHASNSALTAFNETLQTSVMIHCADAATDEKQTELIHDSSGNFAIRTIGDTYATVSNGLVLVRGTGSTLDAVQLLDNRLSISSTGFLSQVGYGSYVGHTVKNTTGSGSTNHSFVDFAHDTSTTASIIAVHGTDGSSRFDFATTPAGSRLTERRATAFKLEGDGRALAVSPTGGLGYGTGAGGTVTQVTSKSTSVTLNKPCGQITMHNAALAGGASVLFIFTNSLISVNDTIQCNVSWGAFAPDSYEGHVFPGAGTARVVVKNVTGGSLSEAVTINFAIIKGAAA